MSAMPARAPRVATASPRTATSKKNTKSAHKRAQSQWKRVVVPAFAPALETLNVSIPTVRNRRRAFSYVVAAAVISGLLLLGFVNILSARASFEKRQLTIQLSDLTSQQQQLERQVALQESPGNLINVARRMGMIPAAAPAFIRLSDHKILGHPEPARKGQ